MKRSRIRRKARVPKPWIDEDVRRAYMESHPRDELERWLDGEAWHRILRTDFRIQLDPHHILHTGGVRWDRPWNLLSITRRSHKYLHHVEPIAHVAVLYAKFSGKRKSARDGIRSYMTTHYQDPIGWVQAKRDAGEIPEHYLETSAALLELF